MTRLEELLEKLRAQTATPDELTELKQQLSTPEGRAAAREILHMESTLHSAFRAAPVLTVLARMSQPQTVARTLAAWGSIPFQQRWMPWAVAAALVLCIGWFTLRPTVGLEAVHGPVTVQREGKQIPGVEGLALRAGDVVRTAAGAGARIQWRREATRVELQAGAELRLSRVSEEKHLALLSGTLTAEVAKQTTRHPMLIETRNGRIEVLGTRFELSAATHTTRVAVTSGTVLLTAAHQDSGYLVEACQSGEVDAAGEVAVQSLPVEESVQMGLLAHWPLDEGQGRVARDASGAGHPLKLIQARWGAGRDASAALDFAGSWMRASSEGGLLPEVFTVSLWAFIGAGAEGMQPLVGNNPSGTSSPGFRLFVNRQAEATWALYFSTVGPDGTIADADSPKHAFKTGQWHHVCAAVDRAAGRVALYLDGEDVTKHRVTRRDFQLSAPLHLGELPTLGRRLQGALQEVRIYQRLLSPAEVQRLAAGHPK